MFISTFQEAEERIRELEDKFIDSENQKEKRMKKTKQSLRDLCDSIKHTNVHIMGIRDEEEKESGRKNMCTSDGRNLPALDERHESTHPRILTNFKNDELKEIHTETNYNQTVQRQR